MIKLTKEQVIIMHNSLIDATGGTFGVRDEGLLESPFLTFGGYDIYPSLMQKAARIAYSLVANHPFVDGNKRIGIHVMLVFLALNGIEISCTQDELVTIGLSLAEGVMSSEELSVWLGSHN